jgi:glycine betaine/proline transport system permease protein
MFNIYTIPLDQWISTFVKWLSMNVRDVFQVIRWPVDQVLGGLNGALLWLPPIVILIIVFLIAWRVASWRVGVFGVLALAFVGFLGLWDDTMTTMAMVLSAVFFCVVIGVPLGILASRSEGFAAFIRPVLDVMQTTPSFVYLVPVVMLFGIGTVPGVIGTVVFSMPPIVRLTNLGLRQVQSDVIEAATAFGSTENQMLWKVQFPLAMPTVMAGLNQTLMLSLSMVVIAAMIGAAGLGRPVFFGLNNLNVGLGGIGGIGIVLLAMVIDRITQGVGQKNK